jgi:phytoene dehydrogenase-like protein
LRPIEEDDITITFLRHALVVIHGFVRESQVYDTVQSIAKAPALAVSFSGQLESLATAYIAIHNADHEKWNRYRDATRKAMDVLNLFNIKPVRPLMLAIAHTFSIRKRPKRLRFVYL